jgi:cell division protein FtsN
LAQDDYYYEIQLTNKQLVFYFMAGAAGLILSFLAGVMVGRGVEGGAPGTAETRVAEEHVVPESPAPAAETPAPYTYPKTLQGDRPDTSLERPAGAATPTPAPRPAARPTAPARPTPAAKATPTPPPTLPPPPAPRAGAGAAPLPKALAATESGFAIQVGAFKDKASADGVVKSLKARGLPAYSVTPTGGGLFTVRVGVYRERADAEMVQERLRDDKFKPYILKQ